MAVKVTGQFEPAGDFSIVDGKDVSGNITGSNISSSGQIEAASIGTNLSSIISGSTPFGASDVSGSWRGELSSSVYLQNVKTTISGSITSVSSSISTRLTTAESELGNTLISSSAQIASDISGSFTSTSSSLAGRLTTEEGNVDTLQARDLIAGAGLTGGGTLASDRTFNVGAGTGVTVNANDVAIGQDVATTSKPLFAAISSSGDISGSSTSTGSFGSLKIADAHQGTLKINGGLTLAGSGPNINGAGGNVYMIPTNFIVRSSISNDSGDVTINDNLIVRDNISGSVDSTGSFGRVESNTFNATTFTSTEVTSTNLTVTGTITGSSLDVSGDGIFGGNITTLGDVIAKNYIVSSSVTHMTQSFSSGSTIFGDTQDDTHQFTGSLSVTGSQIHLRRSALSGFDEYDDDLLVIERSGDYSNLNLVSDVGSYLLFSDATRAVGTIGYVHSSNSLTFGTNGTADALVIDSSQNSTFAGDIISTKANGLISGSSTSTGSFDRLTTNKITRAHNQYPRDIMEFGNYSRIYLNKNDSSINAGLSVYNSNSAANDPGLSVYQGDGDAPAIVTSGNNASISGSSTSTGSFGQVKIGKYYNLQTVGGSKYLNNVTIKTNSDVDFNILDSSYTSSFYIDQSVHKVGLGEFSQLSNQLPTHALHIRTKSGTNPYIKFQEAHQTDVGYIGYVRGEGFYFATSAGSSGNKVYIKNGSVDDVLTVDANSGGRIGINTTTPGVKGLEVVGHVSASATSTGSFGALQVPGNVSIGTESTSHDFPLVVQGADNSTLIRIGGASNSDGGQESEIFVGNAANSKWHNLKINAYNTRFTVAGTETLKISANSISGSSTSTGSFGAVAIGGTLQPGLGFQSYKQALIKNGLAIGANSTYNGLDSGNLDVWTDVRIRNTSGTTKFLFDVSEGDFISSGANAKISGSSTSTGSFGNIKVGDNTAQTNRSIMFGGVEGFKIGYAQSGFLASTGAASDGADAEIVMTGTGGSAPFNNHGSIVYKTRAVDAIARSSHIFYTGRTSAERVRIDHDGNVGIGTASPSTMLHLVSSTGGGAATEPHIRLENTNDDNNSPQITFMKNAGDNAEADNDGVGVIRFKGQDDGDTETEFATIYARSIDVTNGTEDGDMHFRTMKAGTLGDALLLSSGNVEFPTATTISGSATSTGSFGRIILNDNAPIIGNDGVIIRGASASTGVNFRVRNGYGNDTFRVHGHGNLAIGGAFGDTGATTLHIRYIAGGLLNTGTGINEYIRLEDNSNKSGSIGLGSNGNLQLLSQGGTTSVKANSGGVGNLTVDGKVHIGSTATPAEALVVVGNVSASADSTGSFGQGYFDKKIGIGTTSPSSELELTRGDSTATLIKVGNTSTGAAGIYIDASNGDYDGSDYVTMLQNNDKSFTITTTANAGNIVLTSKGVATLNLDGGRVDAENDLYVKRHITGSANIVSTGANAKISGSSTSTGSFGAVTIGAVPDNDVDHPFELQGNMRIDGDIYSFSSGVRGYPRRYISFGYGLDLYTGGDTHEYNHKLKNMSGRNLLWVSGDGAKVSGSSDSTGSFGRVEVNSISASVYQGQIGSRYVHSQTSNSATWTINHNIGHKYPVVTVYDTSDQMILPQNGVATDSDTFTLTFNEAIQGKAVVSVGGIGENAGANYIHTQGGSSTNWRVTHSLSQQYPNVTVYDDTNQVIIPETITAASSNEMDITFSSGKTGYANFSIGSGIPNISAANAGKFLKVKSGGQGVEWVPTTTDVSGSMSVSGSITPNADNTYDLGSASKRWANLYTGDIELSNEGSEGNEVDGTTGSWTIQEGEDDLYLLNRKNGKKYKFKLEEIT